MERNKYPDNQINVSAKAFFQGEKLIIRVELDPIKSSPAGGRTCTPHGRDSFSPYSPKIISLLPHIIKPPKLTNKISRPSKEERALQYLPLAKQLSKTIQTQKKVKHTLPRLKSWANEMRYLSETNGVSFERMEKVIDWYDDFAGCEYIPVVESGRAFREKFIRLESAMQRESNPNSNKPKTITDDGTTYQLCPDGKYRHKRTGSIYIP